MSEQKDVSTKAEVLEILSRYLPPDLLAQVMGAFEREEQLLRDTLLYLKHIAPYSYSNAPRAIDLLDRAAELGIIPEVQP